MNLKNLQAMVALAIAVPAGTWAASPVIGTAMTNGSFRVDQATVRGNATLFEGSVLETATASSAVQLSNGTRLELSADSRGRLYGDRLILEKGQGELAESNQYRFEALGLWVEPVNSTSRGRIAVGGNQVLVAALDGSFRIRNSAGQIVANLPAGTTLSFEPQVADRNAARVTGCLETQEGHYVLTDEVTNLTVELGGAGLASEAGNRVEITGAMDPTATPVKQASQYIRVSQVRQLNKGCGNNGAIAAAAGAGGASAGGGILGVSVTTVAVIGGVAAAAAVGGLAAADALPGQGGTVSR